jgi:malate dehydrogenase (oxaloacetate-decarboxylating)(NADP+)
LELGDIGAMSGKLMTEDKGLLFKIFAGIDVFDIEVDEKDPEKFIQAVKDIAALAKEPVMALLSHSNFGADTGETPALVHEVVEIMQKEYPKLAIDCEMQANFALNKELRDIKYPFIA